MVWSRGGVAGGRAGPGRKLAAFGDLGDYFCGTRRGRIKQWLPYTAWNLLPSWVAMGKRVGCEKLQPVNIVPSRSTLLPRKPLGPPVTCTPAQHHPAARREPLFCWAVATDDGFVPEKPHLALESRSCLRLGTRGLQQPWPISCRNLHLFSSFPPPFPICLGEVVGNARETRRQRER